MKQYKTLIDERQMAEQENYYAELNAFCDRFEREYGHRPTYHIHTFGCQQNENDSEKIAGVLEQGGFTAVDDYESADLVVLNTCSIRENADGKLYGHLGILKTLKEQHRERLTLTCGCMMTQPQHVEKIRKSYGFVDLIFGPQDIYRLPELLAKALSESKITVDVSMENTLAEGIPISRARKFRALVSIMHGCNKFCTYCIVPYTRGRERSRLGKDILSELRQLVDEGYTEVMLLGQNVNAWGKDLKRENAKGGHHTMTEFSELLEAAAQIDGLKRIRFMSPYPSEFTDDVIDVIARYENIEPHLHMPLQSGSDRILRKMNRRYTKQQFIDLVEKVRKARPGITITTDIIVGFPGETEEDFRETLDVMDKIRFDSAFTFIYSPRPGTPAAEYDDQIPIDIVNDRFQRLLAMQNEHNLESNAKLEGETRELLLEGVSGGDSNVLTGRTADFRLVNVSVNDAIREQLPEDAFTADRSALNGDYFEGRYITANITKAKPFSLEGEMTAFV